MRRAHACAYGFIIPNFLSIRNTIRKIYGKLLKKKKYYKYIDVFYLIKKAYLGFLFFYIKTLAFLTQNRLYLTYNMKICVITDIHSNIFALKAAFEKIDEIKPDKIICLGDIVGNGAFPEETVEYIRKRKDVDCVTGNHDFIVLADLDKFPDDDPRLATFRWQAKVLSSASKKFLSSLKKELRFKVCGKEIVAFHYPRNRNGRFKNLVYKPTAEDIKRLFYGIDGDVFLFGHEHTGSFTELNGKYYLNFGTLGNMLEPNVARFGILTINSEGEISYELQKVEYDDSLFRTRTAELTEVLNSSKRT